MAVALGFLNPGLDYYESITDGEGEAMLLKARQESMREVE